MNLSADLGEGSGADHLVLPRIDSASVCCGAHAGSPELSAATAARCRDLGVELGAHPGYPDREGFGRRELGLGAAEIGRLVEEQVAGLGPIAYVKAHGALYHRCQADPEAAAALARVAAEHGAGLVGQPGREILAAARRLGIPGHREGYADRAYRPDGSLLPRERPGAVLGPAAAADQALRLARSGEVDTVCLHGDGPHAAAVAEAVRAAFERAGIATGPLRTAGA